MSQQNPFSMFPLSWAVCALLVAVALALIATVLIPSRNSFPAWQRFKATLAVLVWLAPAAAILYYLGLSLQPAWRPVVSQQASLAAVSSPGIPAATDFEPGRPRLRVRETSSEAPKWTTADNIAEGRELLPLSSERFATLAEAEENVTKMALKLIAERWRSDASRTLTWGTLDARQEELIAAGELPKAFARGIETWSAADTQTFVDLINRSAVKDLIGEVMDWDFKNGTTGKMYRAHLRLDLSPTYHNAVHAVARGQVIEHRLIILGGMLGLATLMLGTSAGYFKLDDATRGTYRRRLQLAAVAVIAAGSLATAHVLS